MVIKYKAVLVCCLLLFGSDVSSNGLLNFTGKVEENTCSFRVKDLNINLYSTFSEGNATLKTTDGFEFKGEGTVDDFLVWGNNPKLPCISRAAFKKEGSSGIKVEVFNCFRGNSILKCKAHWRGSWTINRGL